MSNLRDLRNSEHLTLLPAAYQCENPLKGDRYKLERTKAVYRCKYNYKDKQDQQEKSRYVIVKIAERIAADTEINVLEKIKDCLKTDKNTELSRKFTAYIESGNLDGGDPRSRFKWLSIEEVHPPMSLSGFCEAIKDKKVPCPHAVPLVFFSQIHSALKFLHEQTGFAHRDLNDGNIILRFMEKNGDSATDATTSPIRIEFVIIDFGFSALIAAERNIMDDVEDLRHHTAELCDRVKEDLHQTKGWPEIVKHRGTEDWGKFRHALQGHYDPKTGKDEFNNLSLLGKLFKEFAETVIEVQREELETFIKAIWSLWQNHEIKMKPDVDEISEDSEETGKAGKAGATGGTGEPKYTGRPVID
ncbi:hypothetical protein IQ07DRAFT_600800 [Pyrenochaeta sp. DS3sAY3a]|nr:hypothetical protein IQ07DRAFT_600800 [Pyrenochaeta sp. DS3sAY3a]